MKNKELENYEPGFSTAIIACCVALFGVLFATEQVN